LGGRRVIEIFIDADACPVKDETYAVAARHGIAVVVVANSRMRVPHDLGVEMVVVAQGPDAADDWIVEEARPGDVVVTADLPLAARCIERGAHVLSPNGREFTEDSIGGLVAMRDLKADLREGGVVSGGPPPMTPRDRSRFSGRLEELVRRALRASS
jgi:uncharacterized protein YaiI (UPF0178 family)